MDRTLGIEREWFITENGKISPRIDVLLPCLHHECKQKGVSVDRFGFELFAGQIEDRTPPVCGKESLIQALQANEMILRKVSAGLGLDVTCIDFVSEAELGELCVNPFDKRHKTIWDQIDKERKVAASQVAAIHIHFGVTVDEAVRILNYCREDIIEPLVQLGDLSCGKRVSAYRNMAQVHGEPKVFLNAKELLIFIESQGGEKNVWDMVRYKISTQTVEFRMFGATGDYALIEKYIDATESLVHNALV